MNSKGAKVQHLHVQIMCMVIFIILFTKLLCENLNSLMYEPWKGQSPTLSCANSVILHLMQTGFSQ